MDIQDVRGHKLADHSLGLNKDAVLCGPGPITNKLMRIFTF